MFSFFRGLGLGEHVLAHFFQANDQAKKRAVKTSTHGLVPNVQDLTG